MPVPYIGIPGAPATPEQQVQFRDQLGALDIPNSGFPLRQIANRCQIPHKSDSAKNIMCRTTRRILVDAERIKIVLSNGMADASYSFLENPRGSPITYRASVAIDGQSHQRITWGGAVNGVVQELSHRESDWIYPPTPYAKWAAGMKIVTDIWADNQATGVCVTTNKIVPAVGDLCVLLTGTPDRTMGQAFTGTTTDASIHPSAIIAETTEGATLIIADSNGFGAVGDAGDTEDDGCVGPIERPIAAMPFINVGVPGDWLYYFGNSYAWRMGLAKYCTVAVMHYGGNDISGNRNTALLASARQSVAATLAQYNIPTYLTTLRPKTASSDNWTTTANQTISSAAQETTRTNENADRLTVPAGWAGVFDIAAVVTQNGNKWVSNGTPFYGTPDGTHYSTAASKLVRDSGAIPVVTLKGYRTATIQTPKTRDVSRSVRRRTAQLTMTPDYADGTLITNDGASSQVNFILPSPTEGLELRFLNVTATGLRVSCATGSNVQASSINIGGTATATGGFMQTTTIGAVLRLIAINNVWYAVHSTGAWASS